MSHTSFVERGDVHIDTDWVVVGSGAGGASAAVTLARAGARVTIVEAGAWRDPEHYPSTTWAAMRDLMPDTGAGVVVGRAAWPLVQGFAVGGSTVINSAICVRTPEDIFAEWSLSTGIDGAELGRRMGDAQDALMGELEATPSPTVGYGRMNELAALGAQRVGYASERTHRFVRDCEGAGRCLQGCRARKKRSMNLTFVPEVLTRNGAVLSCAPVASVQWNGKRAIGVSGHFRHPQTRRWGAKFSVRASKGVVIAASATRSAPLLRASGFRHPALGTGFRAHPGTGVMGWYDDPVDMNVGVTQGWQSLAFRKDSRLKLETLSIPFELAASRLPGGGAALTERVADYRHLCMWVLAVRAEAEGTVGRRFGVPWIRYSAPPADMERMREGLRVLAQTHFAAGARWVLPNVAGLPWRISAGELSKIDDASLDPRAWVCILSHLFGGAVLGADPARSVVDVDGRVRGAESLFVADASILPGNIGVNPQLTIMAMARVCAERWL